MAGGANVALTDARGNTPLHYAAGAAPPPSPHPPYARQAACSSASLCAGRIMLYRVEDTTVLSVYCKHRQVGDTTVISVYGKH